MTSNQNPFRFKGLCYPDYDGLHINKVSVIFPAVNGFSDILSLSVFNLVF